MSDDGADVFFLSLEVQQKWQKRLLWLYAVQDYYGPWAFQKHACLDRSDYVNPITSSTFHKFVCATHVWVRDARNLILEAWPCLFNDYGALV